MQLVFEQIRAGGDRNLGYLLADRDAGQGVLIDPSFSPEAFVQRARDQHISIVHVVNTHSHPDHINGNEQATTMTGAPLVAHADAPTQPHVSVSDRHEIAVGSLVLRFFHVPGHCPDHVVVYEPRHGILITGDLLFVGKVGGTRSDEDAASSGTASAGCWSCRMKRPCGQAMTTASVPARRSRSRKQATRSSAALMWTHSWR